MALRPIRAGLVAGTLALALIATACSDSKESEKATTKGTGKSEELAKADCAPSSVSRSAMAVEADSSRAGSIRAVDSGIWPVLQKAKPLYGKINGAESAFRWPIFRPIF